MSAIEERLKTLGIELPQPPPPGGNYVGAVRYGKLVYLSGHGPMQTDGTYLSGKVPNQISTEEAYQAARLTGLNLLATLKAEIGDLDQVKQVIKVLGMVNASPDFKEDYIGVQDRSKKHNALVDAHVARDLYLKLEAGRSHSNGSLTH